MAQINLFFSCLGQDGIAVINPMGLWLNGTHLFLLPRQLSSCGDWMAQATSTLGSSIRRPPPLGRPSKNTHRELMPALTVLSPRSDRTLLHSHSIMRSNHLALLNCKGAREYQRAYGWFGEHYCIYHTTHLQLGEFDACGGRPEGSFHVICHLSSWERPLVTRLGKVLKFFCVLCALLFIN